jgi:hypothetical protein
MMMTRLSGNNRSREHRKGDESEQNVTELHGQPLLSRISDQDAYILSLRCSLSSLNRQTMKSFPHPDDTFLPRFPVHLSFRSNWFSFLAPGSSLPAHRFHRLSPETP